MRHRWQQTASGSKCKNCDMKMIFKQVPAKKVINGNKKVTRTFFQAKGGSPVQAEKTPPCSA